MSVRQPGEPCRHRVPRREAVLVLVLMCGLAVAWFWAAWSHPLVREIGGSSNDSDGAMWFLGWTAYALAHGHNPLISSYALFPGGLNAMWNSSMPLLSVLLAPVTWLANVVTSYNLAVTAGPALSAWAAYLAFRRWTAAVPAVLGGLLFGFSPFMAAQSFMHPFLTVALSAPLMLILFDRLLAVQRAPAWRDGLWLGLLVWAQLLISEEILAMEAITALVGLAVLVRWWPRLGAGRRLKHAASGIGVAAATCLALGAVPLAFQFFGPSQLSRAAHQPGLYVTDLLNFVAPTSFTALHTHASVTLSQTFAGHSIVELGSYVGIPLLVFLALAVVLARRRPLVWVGLGIVVVSGVFSLGPELHIAGTATGIPLPWAAVTNVPLLDDILPSRFGSMMFLGVALVAALAFDELRHRRTPGRLAGWALGLIAMASVAPVIPFPAATVVRPAAFTEHRACPQAPDPVVVLLPASAQDPLLWQAESDFCFHMPTAAGITESAAVPPSHWSVFMQASVGARFGSPLPPMTPATRAQAQSELSSWGAQELVLGPQPRSGLQDAAAQLRSWLTELLGVATRRIGESLVWIHPHVVG